MPEDTVADAPRGFTAAMAETLAATWESRREEIEAIAGSARERMLRALAPRPGDALLELAAGTGETGFDALERARPGGRLICSDISPAMLDTARRRGAARGVTDVEYRVIDAERIDLEDDAVDGVICRFGVMLMEDPAAAMAEARRVLRAGGRLVLAVWGPPERNPFFSIPAASLVRRGHIPPPEPPPAPGIFAMSDPARTAALLRSAGFADVGTEEVTTSIDIPDAGEHVALIADTAGPLAVALRGLSGAERAAVTDDVARALAPFADGTGHALPGSVLVTAAR